MGAARLVAALALACLALAPASARAATGDIHTVAGTGTGGYAGDGGPATAAELDNPAAVAATPDGGFLIADRFNERIRRVSRAGTITTVAGTGTKGFSGDGGPATGARINGPFGVAATGDGGFLIADRFNYRVRRVSPAATIATVAGTGIAGYSGDGGPATGARLDGAYGVAATPDGGFLIADYLDDRIRRVSPAGTITTVAGMGATGFGGDGGPATAALLNGPISVAATADGGFLIAEYDNQRVRRVSPTGTITTVAGTGTAGFSGDGGPATGARLNGPIAVSPTPDGGYLVADYDNHRVRRVSAAGTITTVAGTGSAGFSGDDGPATAAALNYPVDVAATPDGGFLIADQANQRIRYVEGSGPPPPYVGDGSIALRLSARRRQRAKKLFVRAGCGTEACTVKARGRVKVKRGRRGGRRAKKLRLRRKTVRVSAGERERLRLKLRGRQRRKLVRLLKHGAKAKATIRATATNPAGGRDTDRVRVRLKRKRGGGRR